MLHLTPRLPKLYGRKFGELSDVRAKRDFAFGARQLLEKGLKMSPDKPFRIMGDVGELHILPPKYAYEVRNNEQLSFTMAAFKGFREGTNESHIMKLVARHQLTHQLTLVTGAVSEECALVLKDVYTDSPEWYDIAAKDANIKLMARITSRVFLGK
ncbi:unnamed protein product [Fusarium graminearum]|nr:unnamed protein product [Fusarium graminearum]